MYKKVFTSITFVIALSAVMVHILIAFNSSDTVFFGLNPNNLWTKLFLFNPKTPLNFFGLNFLTSSLYHSSTEHLLVNLFIFLLVGGSLENKTSKKSFLTIIILIQLLTLLFVILNYQIINAENTILLSGLSAITIGLLAANFIQRQHYLRLFIALLILSYYAYQSSTQIIDPHFVSFIIGAFVAFLGQRLHLISLEKP